jgi:hypothetical protein
MQVLRSLDWYPARGKFSWRPPYRIEVFYPTFNCGTPYMIFEVFEVIAALKVSNYFKDHVGSTQLPAPANTGR